jgi:hypothetical protein
MDRTRGRASAWIAVLGAVAFVMSGCSNKSSGASFPSGTIVVTEKDYSIAVDPDSSSSGSVTFGVQNDGPATHEFVVFKTDLAEDALPVGDDGDVDEEGQGVTHIDEKEDIAAGSTTTLAVNLEPGKYALICNLPGHYKLGMHTSFTVGG